MVLHTKHARRKGTEKLLAIFAVFVVVALVSRSLYRIPAKIQGRHLAPANIPTPDPATDTPTPVDIAVILSRALFECQDHVDRIHAIRDTWGGEPGVSVKVLDYGVERFQVEYSAWSTNWDPAAYQEAESDLYLKVPSEEALDSWGGSPASKKAAGQWWKARVWTWALAEALREQPQADWLLLGQDMLYVHMPNLRQYLGRFEPRKEAVVLGNRLKGFGGGPMVSPWGQLLSRAAAEAFVDAWRDWCGAKVAAVEYLLTGGDNTDYAFSWCWKQLPVPVQDTRDAQGRDRFFLWPPSRIDRDDWWDSWFPTLREDPPTKELSPETVLFFFASAPEIRQLATFMGGTGPVDEAFLEGNTFYRPDTWRLLDPIRTSRETLQR